MQLGAILQVRPGSQNGGDDGQSIPRPIWPQLEIYSRLNKRAVQCEFISEPALVVVVLQVAPTNLREDGARQLDFQAALHLITPVRAVDRVPDKGSALAVYLIS